MGFDQLRQKYRLGVLPASAGATLIAAGVLLLLNNLHAIPDGGLFTFWPLIATVGGLAYIADSLTPTSLIWGGLAAALGALLFLDNLNLIAVDFGYVWPMIVVAFGITVTWKAQDSHRSS
jgi:uncharacterized membrane protein